MAYPLSSSFNIPITRHPFFHHTKSPSRIFCLTKNQLGQCDDDTSVGITERIMKSVIPILFATTIQFSSIVPYVSSPSANAILYSPDTKVPRTGEVALRRAIPASPNMKAIQVVFSSIMHACISYFYLFIYLCVLFEFLIIKVMVGLVVGKGLRPGSVLLVKSQVQIRQVSTIPVLSQSIRLLEHWCEVGRKLEGWKIKNKSMRLMTPASRWWDLVPQISRSWAGYWFLFTKRNITYLVTPSNLKIFKIKEMHWNG